MIHLLVQMTSKVVCLDRTVDDRFALWVITEKLSCDFDLGATYVDGFGLSACLHVEYLQEVCGTLIGFQDDLIRLEGADGLSVQLQLLLEDLNGKQGLILGYE
jgi:hypothetical protein